MNTQLLLNHLVGSLSSLAHEASRSSKSDRTDEVILKTLSEIDNQEPKILESIEQINQERILIGLDTGQLVGDLNSNYGGACTSQDLIILEGLQVIANSSTIQEEHNPRAMAFIYRMLKNIRKDSNPDEKKKMVDEVRIVADLSCKTQ